MLRFLKSPAGIAITAVMAVLVASPEARKTVRKWAVKGTAAALDLIDQAKESTHHLLEKARNEHELPDSFKHSNTMEDKKSDIYDEDFIEQK